MRTREKWLDKLPQTIKTKAYQNINNTRVFPEIVMQFEFPYLEKALIRAFDFETSPERSNYWWDVIFKYS